MTTIHKLRTRIAALQAERTALSDGPASKSEAHAALAAQCDQWAADAAQRFGHLIRGLAYGGSCRDLFQFRIPQVGQWIDLAEPLAGLLGGPGLTELLSRYLNDISDGPTAAERAQRLAELDSEILALGIEEEALIEASEAAGAAIARRADADPRAVLRIAEPRVSAPALDEEPAAAPVVPTEPLPKPPRIARSEYVARSRNSEGKTQ